MRHDGTHVNMTAETPDNPTNSCEFIVKTKKKQKKLFKKAKKE